MENTYITENGNIERLYSLDFENDYTTSIIPQILMHKVEKEDSQSDLTNVSNIFLSKCSVSNVIDVGKFTSKDTDIDSVIDNDCSTQNSVL